MLIILGLLLAGAGWYIRENLASWAFFGYPSFMKWLVELTKVDNDFLGLQTASNIKSIATGAMVVGVLLVILGIINAVKSRR